MEMEGEEIRALDTSADSEFSILDSSVPSPDYSPPDEPSRIPEQEVAFLIKNPYYKPIDGKMI